MSIVRTLLHLCAGSFLLISIFPLQLTHAEEPSQATKISVPRQPCTPGEGPTAPAPPEKCVDTRGDVEEVANDVFTNTTVTIRKDGAISVCSKTVPLGTDCRPVDTGWIRMCDYLSGAYKCSEQDKGAAAATVFGELFHKSQTEPAFQDDLAAHALTASIREQLLARDTNSYYDPLGFLIPKSPTEGTSIPDDAKRIVTLPRDQIEELASGPALLQKARAYIADQRASGGSIAESPITGTRNFSAAPFTYSTDHLLVDQMFDTGARVRIYADGATLPASNMPMNGLDSYGRPYEAQPDSPSPALPYPYSVPLPEADPKGQGFKKLDASYSTFVRNETNEPVSSIRAAGSPSSARYLGGAVQFVGNTYAAVVTAAKNTLRSALSWFAI